MTEKLRTQFKVYQSKQPEGSLLSQFGKSTRNFTVSIIDYTLLQNDTISILSTYRDLYLTSTSIHTQKTTREAISLHLLNHVTQFVHHSFSTSSHSSRCRRKRRQILKNNDRLTKSSDPSPPEDAQDQGFTRPSILVLLPFRSAALSWLKALSTSLPPTTQIENHARFQSEYGLPEGVVDKLAEAEPGTWPEDHRETFKGNIDDNFRMGVKMTRNSIKLYAEFYTADLILASPLGLKMVIEKQKYISLLLLRLIGFLMVIL
jgi:U3 small nucleolar RNA-associated protein 25